MNNLLSTATGFDMAIQKIQMDVYTALTDVWAGTIDGYGKVYKNPVNTGERVPDYYQTSKIVTPSWYNALEKDYQDAYYDDNKAAVFCFLTKEEDKTKDSILFTADVKLAFMVNLDMIYPGYVERQDSRAQEDVMQILRNNNYERFGIMGIERRIDFVFREYTTNSIRFNDMHPLHCFAVLLKVEYYLTDKC